MKNGIKNLKRRATKREAIYDYNEDAYSNPAEFFISGYVRVFDPGRKKPIKHNIVEDENFPF